ncbi:GAF domain-containing protein [Planomonospora sp. ID91781]|uniref:ATP-binding protein n=1 Tax=Planomonospora sp. ID91781 TaxID=2738135 RepID=UPI0018C39584|nr:ATP-binding protein [Planomonospora sp. ID91781]MBG0822957.1 GAF domain-containing protein [Planomonospora sp. ID91781]
MGASDQDRIGDPERLQALHATGLLDAPEVPVLDRVTRMTTRLLDVPVAMVSLITEDRQVVVSTAGMADPQAVRENPLARSLCRHVVADDAPLVIDDARGDGRWHDLVESTGGRLAAYAGVPLNTPAAQVIGVLCVIDATARTWSREQVRILEDLAALIEPEIALRLARADAAQGAAGRQQERTFLRALLDSLEVSVMACDENGRLVINRPLRESLHTDTPPSDVHSWLRSYPLYAPDGRTPLAVEEMPLARAWAGECFHGRQVVAETDAGPRRFLVNGRPIDTPEGHRLGALVAGHDITDSYRIGLLREAQQAVTRVLADAASSQEAAAGVAAAVTDALGWAYGEYWQVDGDQRAITRIGSWSRPGRDLSAFTADHPEVFVRGEELPGLAWERGEPVWIADTAAEPAGTPRVRAGLRAGLRSAVALPVRSGAQVLGVLTFAGDHPRQPDDDLADLLDGVCAHVGRYMERRRAEELALELAESRRRFDRIIDQLTDKVWTVEIRPDGTARPVYVNTEHTTVFGGRLRLSPDDDFIAVMLRFVHPGDRDAFGAFCAELIAGRRAELEYRLIGLDGVTRWIWSRGAPRREGERLLVDGISTDVTDRRQITEERERLLVQQQQQVRRLRQVDEVKNQFLRTVNHELRTPLTSIHSYLQLIREGDLDAATQARFLEVIDRNSTRLGQLLDELLLMASLNAGNAAFTPAETDLVALAQNAVQAITAQGRTEHLAVTVHAPAPVIAWADAGRIRHALAHLLDNAVKFTPPGGRIDVTVTAGPAPAIEVADTGTGIDPQDLDHVSDDFYRGGTAEQRAIGGTGVGLALVRRIADMHGGNVHIESGPGHGTRVRLTLPAKAAPAAARQARRRSSPSSGRPRRRR